MKHQPYPIPGHEYLVQRVDDYDHSKGFEVLDLSVDEDESCVVFRHKDYDKCNAWIDGEFENVAKK